MKASQFLVSTLKEAPADAEVASHKLMMRAGMIKPIAVTAKARVADLPDVPAIGELLPGYGVTSWIARF